MEKYIVWQIMVACLKYSELLISFTMTVYMTVMENCLTRILSFWVWKNSSNYKNLRICWTNKFVQISWHGRGVVKSKIFADFLGCLLWMILSSFLNFFSTYLARHYKYFPTNKKTRRLHSIDFNIVNKISYSHLDDNLWTFFVQIYQVSPFWI